tara:strand:- start:416 stop:985 length:570 start_codon:yes stop_codon:yes gene_type:complete
MKNNRRRKFTTYKFFVEGQICKIFISRRHEFEKGFWAWHVGFAVGKSVRQINDWYSGKRNKRARSLLNKITGKSGIKTYTKAFRHVLKLRWLIEPGDTLYFDCTSSKSDKQFIAGLRWHKRHPEWTIDYENKIFFWHRPPYSNDDIWEDNIIIGKIPANPLLNTENNQYYECFSALPKDQCKAKSKHQN